MACLVDPLLRLREISRQREPDNTRHTRRAKPTVAGRRRKLALEALEERLTPSGETVTATFNAIPVQKTVQVSFDATIDSPLPKGIDRVFGQGSVSGSGFATIKTDASQLPGTGDPLVTPVERAPMVAGVYVRSSGWATAFLNNLQTQGLGDATLGYSIPTGTGQLTSIPWPDLDRVSVRFTSGVNIAPGTLSILGTYISSYAVNAAVLSYDPATFTATWALSTPLVADGLRLIVSSAGVTSTSGNARLDGEWLDGTAVFPSGNGAAGTDFSFRFNVVPGDVNRDGVSSSADLLLVRQYFGGTLPAADVNGDGTVTQTDFDLARTLLGKGLIVIPPGGRPGNGWVPSSSTPTPPNPPGVRGTTVTARVEAFLLVDVDRDGRADPGDTVRYVVSIRNLGTVQTSATLTDTLDGYMTLVPGSVRLSPVAFDDHYTMTSSTTLTIPAVTGVLANDVDPNTPTQSLAVITANTTQQFDQVAVNSDGSFTFTPATGAKGSRAFLYTVGNTSGMMSVGTAIVDITDSAPVLAGIEATSLAYTQGNPPTPVTSSLTVSDADDLNLAGATVAITGGTYVSGQDVLSFTNQNGIIGNFNTSTGVMTLSGMSSVANYQAALRSVRYANTSSSPNFTPRILTFAANDGFTSSNTVTRTLNVLTVHFVITAPSTPTAGSAFAITVLARDQANNPATAYTGTVHFTKTDTRAGSAAPADYTFVPGDLGSHTFANGVTFVTAGPQSLTATDTANAAITTTASLTVNPAAVATFVVTAPSAVNPGAPFSITVTAKDAFNNIATGYAGTVHFTHSDFNESASVPGDYTFVPPDAGTHTFTNGVVLQSAGLQTVTATDTVNGTVTGTSNTITVDARPIVNDDNFTAVGNTELRVGTGPVSYPAAIVSGSLLGNDSDPDGNLPITVTNVSTAGLQGSLTINPNGTFTFSPTVGFSGATFFTYRVIDTAGNLSAATATVTIMINSRVWYVNSAYAGGNGPSDGSSARPLTALTNLNGAGGSGDLDGPNDFIFVYQGGGTYAGGIELEAGQKLYGQPFGLTVSGYTLVTPGGGPNPTLTNAAGAGITLAEGVEVQRVDVANTLGDGIAGPDGLNFATVGSNMSVTNAGQKGLRLFGGFGTVNFGADIFGSGSEAVSVAGRTGGSVTVSGNITSGGAAEGIRITDNSGGAVVTFSGASKTLSSGAFAGIVISGNNSATVNFVNGGLDITTTSGDGISAVGGGTLNISGSDNTIRTQSGIALKVDGVSIGAAGLTFRSISAGSFGAGPDHGIYLFATGSVAGLTITGDGLTQDSGGTIRNTNFEAIYLVDAVNVDLSCLTITGTGFDMAGIFASGISGFSLDRGLIIGTGCDAMTFDSTVSGDITITNTNVIAPYMDGLYASLSSGTANWTINNCIFDNCGNDAIAFVGDINGTVSILDTVAGGSFMAGLFVEQFSGSADWTISDSFFVGSGCDGLSFAGTLNGTVTIRNTFVSQSAMWGLYAELDDGASTWNISNSTFDQSQFDGIAFDLANTAVVTSTISGCTVTDNNQYGYYFLGINLRAAGSSTLNATVSGNTLSGNTRGIYAYQSDDGLLTALISGNTLNDHTLDAIDIEQHSTNTSAGFLRVRVQGNTIGTAGAPESGSAGGMGVRVNIDGNNTSAAVAIVGNTIREVANNYAIGVFSVNETTDVSKLDVTISGNTVLAPTLSTPASPIYLECDDGDMLHADIQNNVTFDPNAAGGSGVAYELVATPMATFTLFRTSPAFATALAQLQATNSPTSPITITGTITLTTTPVSLPPQLASGGQRYGGIGVSTVTPGQLSAILAEAEDRWAALGLSDVDLARLHAVTAEIADLPDGYLGAAPLYGNTIYVDVTAAGYGWFVDATPADDSEFALSAGDSPAAERIDLLTVVMHELGHVLGLDSRYNGDGSDLMDAFLGTGARRLPGAGDLLAMQRSDAQSAVACVPESVASFDPRSCESKPAATKIGPENPVASDAMCAPRWSADALTRRREAYHPNTANWWDVAAHLRRAKQGNVPANGWDTTL